MATTVSTTTLRAKINALQAMTEKDSISPATVASILGDIADHLDALSVGLDPGTELAGTLTDINNRLNSYSRSTFTTYSSGKLIDTGYLVTQHRSQVDGTETDDFTMSIPYATTATGGLMSVGDARIISSVSRKFFPTGISASPVIGTGEVSLTLSATDFEGVAVKLSGSIPAATVNAPGIMTREHVRLLDSIYEWMKTTQAWITGIDEWFAGYDPATVADNASEALKGVRDIYELVGKGDGFCPLDEFGRVPVANLPVGRPDGVCPLDEEGQVPRIHLRDI